MDREELQRRKLQRQQKKSTRRRSLLIKVIAAVVILAITGGLIFYFVRRNSASDQNNQGTGTPSTTVIHLAAAGDLNVTDRVVESDFSKAFFDVAYLLADADMTMLNLEGGFFGAPYGTAGASAPITLATALSKAGVDILQLANSYAIYDGMQGLANTIQSVKQAGISPLGVYADKNSAKAGKGYIIREIQGVKVAFVAFTKGMDGTALPEGNDGCVNLLYTDYDSTYQKVNTAGIKQILGDVKKESPDLTVALLHWGSEFNDTISATQNTIRDLMLENGVDAIIGTHPHYVQKMEFNQENGTFVAYSLGDFFGDAARAGSEYSVILDLEITKNNDTGETKVTGFTYTPIFTVAEEDQPLKVVRIQEAIASYEAGHMDRVSPETYEKMKYALTRIEARINGK